MEPATVPVDPSYLLHCDWQIFEGVGREFSFPLSPLPAAGLNPINSKMESITLPLLGLSATTASGGETPGWVSAAPGLAAGDSSSGLKTGFWE